MALTHRTLPDTRTQRESASQLRTWLLNSDHCLRYPNHEILANFVADVALCRSPGKRPMILGFSVDKEGLLKGADYIAAQSPFHLESLVVA
jgi:hypothetical protein